MEGNSDEIEKIFSAKKHLPILGNEKFIDSIRSLKPVIQIPLEITGKHATRATIGEIIKAVSSTTHIKIDAILSVKKIINIARELVILIAKNNYGYELSEIAAVMNIKAASSVSASTSRTAKRLKNKLELQYSLKRALELLNN